MDNAMIVSYPKSGRTWLRMIFAKILDETGMYVDHKELLEFNHCLKFKPNYYKKDRYVFLYRDPRDVVISHFFELKDRMGLYEEDLSYFIRDSQYGVKAVIDYLIMIYEDLQEYSYYLVAYEDLHRDTFGYVKTILKFIGWEVTPEITKKAIAYSHFNKMKRLELDPNNILRSYKGTFGTRTDESKPNTFRIRKGQVGGWKKYLNKIDSQYVNAKAKEYEKWIKTVHLSG